MNVSPFQQKLKEQTLEAHKKAEQHPLMQSFINGTYTKEHLLQFLVNIHQIYFVVEQRLLSEKIEQVHDLKRSDLIEEDINSLIKEVITFKNFHLLTPTFDAHSWACNCYNKPKSLLKAELYSRWLADFYGGKMIARTVTPNQMYTTKGDTAKIITTVREILDEPIEGEDVSEEDIIHETQMFFDLHLRVFDFIYHGGQTPYF